MSTVRIVGDLSYDTSKTLGEGSFGTLVFAGFHRNERAVAVKRVQKYYLKDNLDILQWEVELMNAASDHPNILRCIYTTMNDDYLFIATELCSGTLDNYLNGKYEGPRFQNEKEILRQVTQGLAHLHNLKIVHRDIKPANLLIFVPTDEDFSNKPLMKLADFDISKMLKTDMNLDFTNTSKTNPKGTKGWMAPEVYQSNRFDFKVDVWALGLIFAYTLSGGKHPFGDDPDLHNARIKQNEPMLLTKTDLVGNNKDGVFELIKSMLKVEANNRPSVTDYVLKDTFFKDEEFSTTIKIGKLSYDSKNMLGRGSFGMVFRGFHQISKNKSTPVAVKRVERGFVDESVIRWEGKLLESASNHPNILRYIHIETNVEFLFLAAELCRGTLEDYVIGDKYQGPRFPNEKEMLHQLTQGLGHLHSLKIVHRDIKPTNILIFVPLEGATNKQPQIKLADFSISKIIQTNKMGRDFTNTSLTNPSGSRGWMPPELFESDRFDFKVDVWALGCIFGYALTGGKHPFGDDFLIQIERIRKKQPMLLTKKDLMGNINDADKAFDLIKSMLMVEPKNRPTVTDVLKDPFFANKEMSNWSCTVCNTMVNSQKQWNDHVTGQKHLRAVEHSTKPPTTLSQLDDGDDDMYLAMAGPDGSYECRVCPNFTFSGIVPMKEHMKGAKHKKNLELCAVRLPDGQYQCGMCNDGAIMSGPLPMKQHLKGQKHTKNIQRLK